MIKPKFSPLGSKVLIQPDSPSEVTEGGIIFSKAQQPDEGVVLRISPDMGFSIKEGDRVKFQVGTGIMVEGLLLIDEKNILLKYE